jgi:thiosulfate dehydrogenase [quinone] large subunit
MTTNEIVRTGSPLERAEKPGGLLTTTAAKVLAVVRFSLGFVFLWAFLDKTFGLNYSTPSDRAWINGGSPTKGFLSSVDVGPFQSLAHDMAGTWWANWLFMLGLLGIGLALIAGVFMRIAAASGVLMMAMMWFAEFPIAQHNEAGKLTGSTNPITDSHFIYAVVLIALAAAYAGHKWGLGRYWAKLPFVQRHRWLI